VPYVPLTAKDREKILETIGAASFDELLEGLPEELRFKGKLNIRPGKSEQALRGLLEGLASMNTTVDAMPAFVGAGAYNHYVPSTVDALISRSEFFTSYTPYQPEISQGTLQAVFEFQTLVCQLTAMDVANASLYDGASAVAEAALMARRVTRRAKVLLSGALHPAYRETTATYMQTFRGDIHELPFSAETGRTPTEAIAAAFSDDTACLVVQSPNFFGSIEDLEEIAALVHEKGALLVVAVAEPLSLALLNPPGRLGADIVVGDGQSFGNSLSYGGPYVGFMAIRQKFLRQMPGRVVGRTTDHEGRSAFCLTFATREQHIRRERATSNICTNQGLAALAMAIYLVSVGRSGLRDLARINLSLAEYLKDRLKEIPGVSPAFNAPTFNEFALRLPAPAEKTLRRLREKGYIGGVALSRWYEGLDDVVLVCATEMNSKEEMDGLATALEQTLKE
jgi:glycine dehydrogenase subunit 1